MRKLLTPIITLTAIITFVVAMILLYSLISSITSAPVGVKEKQSEQYMIKGINKAEIGDYAGAIKELDEAIEIDNTYGEAIVLRGLLKNYIGDHKGALEDYSAASFRYTLNNNEAINTLKAATENLLLDHESAKKSLESNGINMNQTSGYVLMSPLSRYLRYIINAQYEYSTLKVVSSEQKIPSLFIHVQNMDDNRDYIKQNLLELNNIIDEAKTNEDKLTHILIPLSATKIKVGLIKTEESKSDDNDYDWWSDLIILTPHYRIILGYDISDIYVKKAILKRVLGDYIGSIEDCNNATELNPDLESAYFERGITKDYQGKTEEAIPDFSKAIDLNADAEESVKMGINKDEDEKSATSDNTGILEGLKSLQDEWEDEWAKMEEARRIAWPYYIRGSAKRKLKDLKSAIEDYDKAIKIDTNLLIAYYDRGMTKIEIGQKDEGCLDLSKAGEQGYSKAYDAIKTYCQ